MCLILFALNHHPSYKLVLAANRDEFFNRDTLFANHWDDNQQIIGGRDLVSMGTWLGLNTNGRFIAITNYRNLKRENKNAKSRGILSKRFLLGEESIDEFIEKISIERNEYNGFNLLLSENGFSDMIHYSNITNGKTKLSIGVFGLSNALLDTAWPKVKQGKKMLSEQVSSNDIDASKLIRLLKNPQEAEDSTLPNTGISFDLEKKLSPVFISMNGYGTRCSTVITVDKNDKVKFLEVTYNENQEIINRAELNEQLKY